jgi:hypothetical protein
LGDVKKLTLYSGKDFNMPTFIRRGVSLNR